jgi:hypothetical protein
MNFQFYLKGGIVPAVYDFDMTDTGMLHPSATQASRSKGCVMILLENSGGGPTLEQVATINQLCTINPEWESTFYFETRIALAG